MNTTLVTPPAGELGRARASLAAVRLLTQLGPDANPRMLDDQDRGILAAWSGWGPMTKALDPRVVDQSWVAIRNDLYDLLDESALADAMGATSTSFYTDQIVMDAIWKLAGDLGFTGGDVLEPGCGHGRFMAAAPGWMQARFTGVEADITTARIARLLNPDAHIIQGRLEETLLTPGVFDLAVGNVPFADVTITDPVRPGWKMNVHNYFIGRALDAVKVGGYVIMVTSRFTLDSTDDTQRSKLATMGELVGAVRLPRGAFESFGTDVVTDVVCFRRTDEPDPANLDRWRMSSDATKLHRARTGTYEWVTDSLGNGIDRNEWYHDQPELMLGNASVQSGMYGRELVVVDTGDTEQRLATAFTGFARVGTPMPARPVAPSAVVVDDDVATATGLKGSSFHLVDGVPHQVQFGRLVPYSKSKELTSLIVLRNAVLDILHAEANDASDAELLVLRMILNGLYDRYVANPKYGPLNRSTVTEGPIDADTGLPTLSRRRPQMGGFKQDPDYVTVLSIEEYDEATGEAEKGPIFSRRVNRRYEPVTTAANIAEAMLVSLDQTGSIDLALIGRLLDVDEATVNGMLPEVAFIDPDTGLWVENGEYLSGNVRAKLTVAEEASIGDPRFDRNVHALQAVQPEDLTADEIKVQLGSPWVPVQVIQDFVDHLMPIPHGQAEVTHEPITATWEVDADSWHRQMAVAKSTWGTTRADGFRLVELALNASVPVITDTVEVLCDDGKYRKRSVKNPEETMVATEKQREINEYFMGWVWQDEERAKELVGIYNVLFNSHVARQFDGSHLTFPTLRESFNPYESQTTMVHRALCTPAALCGHVVGAGKTSIMGMIASKKKELGQVTKPAMVVPNHLLEQVSREIKALFPTMRLLMISKDDTTKERRKLFAAKVATGDWDLVVMTYTSFTSIPMGPEVEREYLAEIITKHQQAMLTGDAGESTLKQIAKQVDRLRQRHRDLLNKVVDDGVTWSMLGIDYLMVDEAHYYKNLAVITRSQGLSITGSKRAEDLDMKYWWLRRRSGGKQVGSLFTGTPVSNTLAELYVLQKYLQPERLEEVGVAHFDAWAGAFITWESRIEVDPSGGGFRLHRRPSQFNNVPELRMMFSDVADIRTKKMMNLPGPQVRVEPVVIEASEQLAEYVQSLVARVDKIRARGGRPKKGDDNMLMVCTDGRRAALDMSLLNDDKHDYVDGDKVAQVVARVAAIYHRDRNLTFNDLHGNESPIPGSFQLVFCDLGTPNPDKGPQVYGQIRSGLVDLGVPVEQIRFIHHAKTDIQKAALFADCRSGKVAVLLGSTDKLGVGTNVQHRLGTIHHVDAPWRPADVEQRDGRGDRPGNQHDELVIYRYIRSGSFDAYMWQGLERKARFISQVMTGDLTARTVDDVGEVTLSYSEIKALASGNPLMMEMAELAADVVRLKGMQLSHDRAQRRVLGDIRYDESEAARLEATAQRWLTVAKQVDVSKGLVTSWDAPDIDGADTDGIVDAIVTITEALQRKAEAKLVRWGEVQVDLGTLFGVPVSIDGAYQAVNFTTLVDGMPLSLLDAKFLWLQKPQQYRFGGLLDRLRGAEDKADDLFLAATKRRQTAADAKKVLAEFPAAAELEAAEARVAELEHRIGLKVTEDAQVGAAPA